MRTKTLLPLLILPLLLLPLGLAAQGTATPSGDVVHDNLLRFGDMVTVAGTVEGDAIIGGTTVTVNGTVEGDLLGFATTLIVNGTVNGNVRVAAQTLQINGAVGRNITAAGSTVLFGDHATVGGTVALLATDATLNGTIGGNASVYASRIVLAGTLHRSADLRVDSNGVVERLSGAPLTIEGDLTYRAPAVADLGSGAVLGTVRYTPVAPPSTSHAFRTALETLRVLRFVGTLLLGLVLLWLFPRLYPALNASLKGTGVRGILTGFGLVLGTPIVATVLAVTLIGIPLAVLLVTVYGSVLTLAKLPVGSLLGAAVFERFRWKRNPAMELVVGFAILELALSVLLRALGQAVPILGVLGGLVNGFLAVWVFGAVAELLLRGLRAAHQAKPKPSA